MNELLDRLFALERNQRLIVYGLIAAAMVALYYTFSYSPNSTVISERSETAAARDAEVTKKKNVAARLAQVQEDYRRLEIEFKKAVAQLPDQKEIDQLLTKVSTVGRESGLEILVFRQKPERNQDFYAEVPVEMLMRGSYGQLITFVEKVGKLERIVNVTDISMRQPHESGGRMMVDTSCTAVTARFLSEEERARIAAAKEKK
jgi:type IV pilus assembly protein PilO